MTQALGPVQTPLAPTGSTVYAIVFQRSTGKVRDVVAGAWDDFADADIGDYDVALTEKGTASAIYQGDEPSGLDLAAEAYDVKLYRRAGGSPAIGDTLLGVQCIGAENMNVTAISGDSTAADRLEQMLDSMKTGTVVDDAANSSSTFETDLTETADDYYVGNVVAFSSGTNISQARRISAYNGTTKFITVSPAFDAEPDAADAFFILGRIN